MKRALRILSVVLFTSSLIFWAVKGAHGGWTINKLRHDSSDPVTGLTGVSYEDVFIPGLDFLAVALMGAAALVAASFVFKKKKSRPETAIQQS